MSIKMKINPAAARSIIGWNNLAEIPEWPRA